MSAPRRETHRKPTPAEARRFAKVDKLWRRNLRRKRTRYAAQWAAAALLIVAVAAIALGTLWLAILSLVVTFSVFA